MSFLRKIGTQRAIKTILIAGIFATLAFIFTQSALPPEISSAESDASAEIIAEILPTDTALGGFVFDNIRKIAHFVEFGILGLELAIFVLLFSENKKKAVPKTLIFAFFTAFMDETIQIFSGRVAAVGDVWLDMAGFLAFSLTVYLVAVLARTISPKIKINR